MVKPKNAIIAAAAILICTGALFLLLVGSSVPIFTVKELMDSPNYESFIDKRIQLIGVVNPGINDTGFYVSDPNDVDNSTLIIYIEAVNVERPAGFESGKTVLLEGKLLSITSIWKFKATMISTKCPSKYQEEQNSV